MRKRSIYIVEWEDIASASFWHKEDDTESHAPIVCKSVGWKVKPHKKGYISLAQSRSEHNSCSDVTTIPKKAIKSMRRLE